MTIDLGLRDGFSVLRRSGGSEWDERNNRRSFPFAALRVRMTTVLDLWQRGMLGAVCRGIRCVGGSGLHAVERSMIIGGLVVVPLTAEVDPSRIR